VCAARNAGIAEARGRFIAYLDSDNRWQPTFLARMGEALARPDARVAFCDFNLFGAIRSPAASASCAAFAAVRLCSLLDDNTIDINTLVHDRSVIEVSGVGRADRAHERLDFILRLTAHFPPLHVPEALVDYYFGVCPNTSPAPAGGAGRLRVEEKTLALRRPTITHDTITYTWDGLPAPSTTTGFGSRITPSTARPLPPSAIEHAPDRADEPLQPRLPALSAGRNELGRVRRHMTLEEFKRIVDDTRST